MNETTLTRRTVLRTAVATTALAAPFVRGARGAANVVPSGSMVLAWHTNIAPRWLDPQQHDGGATPDNFLNVLHDALIKNFRGELYDHLALAERYEFAEDARSATFWLRPGVKFHNGSPVTPEDIKWSYEHYHGAWAKVLQDKTDGVEILDEHTLRFDFKAPFLDFPRLMGTANVSGAAWVVPANITRRSGRTGLRRSRLVPGPTDSWNSNRERSSSSRPSTTTTGRCTSSASRSSACRKRRRGSRCSSGARRTSCISCPAS
jgi:ABC-type transport system substrate-binding protein